MTSIRLTPALARSASVIAIAASFLMPAIAYAQNSGSAAPEAATPASQEEPAGDEIVVTGIRASLERSIAIKRESSGVVDAISAEDIGKFPDTNLAESLQRIPGVSINRTNGEGSLVTVRGFGPTYNLVTLNGRQLATSNVGVVGGDQNADGAQGTSRSFDFSNLATEGVRTLEVYKTGRAATARRSTSLRVVRWTATIRASTAASAPRRSTTPASMTASIADRRLRPKSRAC
jgi:outer membrane cobalamin receptor